MKIYLSGKISGDPNWKRKFDKWEKYFVELGYEVINPVDTVMAFQSSLENTDFPEPEWKDYLMYDLTKLSECDVVFLIPDWQESDGAKIEKIFAGHLELKIMYEKDLEDAK